MTPTEELIKDIKGFLSLDWTDGDIGISEASELLQQAVARLKELEREKAAYREVAAKNLLDTTHRPGDNDKVKKVNDNFHEWMLHRVDKDAQRLMSKDVGEREQTDPEWAKCHTCGYQRSVKFKEYEGKKLAEIDPCFNCIESILREQREGV